MDAGIHKVSIVSEQMHQYGRQEQKEKIAQLWIEGENENEIQFLGD